LGLFKFRTFRAAVSGSFFTRLGIGGVPFLLPLLYQVGLGFSPVQSGLLIMPQALAAMGMKMVMPRVLSAIGYRWVLISNTIIRGLLLLLGSQTADLHLLGRNPGLAADLFQLPRTMSFDPVE
jgi:hypothetical protein